jgi:hypothetical protein
VKLVKKWSSGRFVGRSWGSRPGWSMRERRASVVEGSKLEQGRPVGGA